MSISLDELQRRLERAGGAGLDKVVRMALERAGLRGVREAKLSLTNSGNQRTGNLRSSIRHEVRASANGSVEMVLRAGGAVGPAEVAYARMQEYGGTVVPRTAKNLAIPVGPALTRAGVARVTSPRNWPGELDWAPSRGGRATGVLIDAKTGRVAFVLVPSVTIRARRFMAAGLEAAIAGLGKDIVNTVDKILGGERK